MVEPTQGRRKLLARTRSRWAGSKQRAVRASRARASRELAETAIAITSTCNAAIAGFELCARRTHDVTIAVAATSAADFLRVLVEATIAAAAERGIDAVARARTGDRLRWEWLASTATVVDGTSDARLLGEGARLVPETVTAAVNVGELGESIGARLRVASAEAYSLASALR